MIRPAHAQVDAPAALPATHASARPIRMLVGGSLVEGGLTVIASAPNPAGVGLLGSNSVDESVGAGSLFLDALTPTAIASGALLLL